MRTPEEILKLARLARLSVSSEELPLVARELEPSRQHLDDDECIDVEEWTVADLEKLIFEGKITDGKTIAAIMAYARKYHVE